MDPQRDTCSVCLKDVDVDEGEDVVKLECRACDVHVRGLEKESVPRTRVFLYVYDPHGWRKGLGVYTLCLPPRTII
jgi:hypothetical protein